MSEEIIKVVDALAAKLGIAIDWTAANMMPYLQQLADRYIGYEIATNIYWIVVWAFAAIVLWILCYTCYRKADFEDGGDNWAFAFGLTGFAGMLVTAIFVGTLFCNVKEIITCIMLPEQVILDYLKGMM